MSFQTALVYHTCHIALLLKVVVLVEKWSVYRSLHPTEVQSFPLILLFKLFLSLVLSRLHLHD